ncbi:MAG: hypothetical protein PHN69_06375 [Candidatus Pacebacteria bacterium]|nr:hypothetical protein [Candidatus Paceibacterota bacterium]
MKNNKIKIFVIIIIILAIILICLSIFENNKQNIIKDDQQTFDGRNAHYEINGINFDLVNGEAKVQPVRGMAFASTFRYFGNESKGDLNGDGMEDIAFLISQDNGGSGLFYYAVVALQKEDGYKITNPFFIGDRIAPQTTNINTSAKELYINYAERRVGEPMTTQPSMGATKILKITQDEKLTGLMQ